MNNEVINEIDVLVSTIKSCDIYKEYIDLLNKVSASNEIKELTNEIRKINKELVLTPSIELEDKLKLKEKELNEIPLYLEYKYKLEESPNFNIQYINVISFNIALESIIKEKSSILEKKP